MTTTVNLETRPATREEVDAFELANGVGYRYVRIFHGRCANCGAEVPEPRDTLGAHEKLYGVGYSCDPTLPAQWPMRQEVTA